MDSLCLETCIFWWRVLPGGRVKIPELCERSGPLELEMSHPVDRLPTIVLSCRQWALMGPPLNWDILRTKTYLPEESPFMSLRVTNSYLYSVYDLVKPQKNLSFQTPKFGKIFKNLDTVHKVSPKKI